MLTKLLEAFEEQDGDAACKMLKSPFIRSMDVEYSKLARDMPVPACSKVRPWHLVFDFFFFFSIFFFFF